MNPGTLKRYLLTLSVILMGAFGLSAQNSLESDSTVYLDGEMLVPEQIGIIPESLSGDTARLTAYEENLLYGLSGERSFNPDPTRAVWMSALFPGLGQVYNRRYWKIPIIIGGYMALGYGTSWNNNQYQDYSRAYRDLLDNDPTSNSYMNFFPPNVSEDSLDKSWLTSVMKSRKDFYRRNRDLCIIISGALYILQVVDAHVDAHLKDYDISDDLSMNIEPMVDYTYVPTMQRNRPVFGFNLSLNF